MQIGKHTAITFGALFCTALLILPFGVGQTQARYENTVSWKGIYAPAAPVFESNFLAEGGRTILVEDWVLSASSYKTFGIQLGTDGAKLSGTLQCEVDSDLITAKLDQTAFTVDKTGSHAILTLTATAKAAALTEATAVNVRVSWTAGEQDPCWADFRVTLCPSATGTQSPETPNSGTKTNGTMTLTMPYGISVQEQLPLQLTLPQGTDRVVLSCDGGAFPENTVYEVNGEPGFALAYDRIIEIPTHGRQELQIWLDLSWTTFRQARFQLSAVAYAGNEEISGVNKTVQLNRQPLEVELDSAALAIGANARTMLPLYGDTDDLVWSLERLVNSNGESLYTASEAFTIQIQKATDGTDGAVLAIINENTNAPAGTYRLTLRRMYQEMVISSIEITVFVSY